MGVAMGVVMGEVMGVTTGEVMGVETHAVTDEGKAPGRPPFPVRFRAGRPCRLLR